MPERLDNFLSENPIDLILLNSWKVLGRPYFIILFSSSIISFIWFKNHGSTFDSWYILFKGIFFLNASPINNNLFGILTFNFCKISFFEKSNILSNPHNPVSKDTRAFWNDSLKFLPIAIASPTDLIEVPNKAFVSGNFSNVNLGILVTT